MAAGVDQTRKDESVDPPTKVDHHRFVASVREQRLRIFQQVALVATAYYVMKSAYDGAWRSSATHACSLSLYILSTVVRTRFSKYTASSWIYLLGINCSLGATAIFSNSIHANGLWMISLLPMIASCLLGIRETLAFTILSILEIIALAILEPWARPLNEVFDTNLDIAILLALSIGTHALVGYLVSSFLNQQSRMLEHQHQAVELAHDRAMRASEAKSKFLARMSHEIRTPMNAILGMTQHLSRESLPEQSLQAIQTIDRCGDNLLALLNDILDWSSVENDELDIIVANTDLVRIAHDTHALFGAQAQLKQIELVVDCHKESLWCQTDEKRLRQVLCNLVGNAIKFSDRGEIRIKLRSTPSEPGRESIALSVIDQGIGMSPEQQAKVFDQFAQADTQEVRDRGGTGLGLAISAELIRKMGGVVLLESELGKGSTFRIELDLMSGLRPEDAPPSAVEMGTCLPSPSSAEILIVDDQELNREVLRLALQEFGALVAQAASGQDAIELVRTKRFDLIFMDIRMPGMDGMEATRRIQSSPGPNQSTPIVALSANAYREDKAASRQAGMIEHLAKPFRTEQLREAMIRHIPRMREDLQRVG